jgi:fused signal recognition particle receptor
MYNEEGLSGGLGLYLSFGLFAITFVIGVMLLIWFLKSQRSLAKVKKSATEIPEVTLSRRAADRLADVTDQGSAATSVKPLVKPLSDALSKTRASLFGRIQNLLVGRETLSESEREELEEVLYTADLGPKTVQDLLDHVFAKLKESRETGFEAVRRELHAKMAEILNSKIGATSVGHLVAVGSGSTDGLDRLNIFSNHPSVLMVVGVNGAGKTTTIGKISSKLAGRGKRVLVAAGDTFRAAAGEQLKAWTDRAQDGNATSGGAAQGYVEIFDPAGVTEPSAVAYQALERARSEKFDIVIIDTAGRLHTQKNLMEELKKMKRVLAKLDSTAPHETLLVLDANSGQNALIQAREFHGALTVDGVVLTKLDGSAKGGIAVGITNEVGLPVKLIGIGEKIGDLRAFEPMSFVDSILR